MIFRRSLAVAIAIIMVMLAPGCAKRSPSESVEAAPASITGALPCDVERVLVAVCQKCHSSPPRNEAPVALVTYADTQLDVEGKPLWTYMQSAIEEGRMPLPPYELTDAERDTLLGWLRGGATPAIGGECDAPDAAAD
jgi:uncharacterized membrane protein